MHEYSLTSILLLLESPFNHSSHFVFCFVTEQSSSMDMIIDFDIEVQKKSLNTTFHWKTFCNPGSGFTWGEQRNTENSGVTITIHHHTARVASLLYQDHICTCTLEQRVLGLQPQFFPVTCSRTSNHMILVWIPYWKAQSRPPFFKGQLNTHSGGIWNN